jgi:opacity protein-like surface antigen
MKKFILFVSFVGIYASSFSQFSTNADVVIGTKFKGSPYIGLSEVLTKEINNGFCAGGLLGLQFYTGSGITSFRIPIMAEARYFVSGNTDGFYPLAELGIVHQESKTNGLIVLKVSTTNFAFALGAGMKFGNIDVSVKYENVQFSSGHAEFFDFKLGFWMGQSGGGHKRHR